MNPGTPFHRRALAAVALCASVVAGAPAGAAQPNDEPIQPVPLETKLDVKKVALGKKMFFDKRLSGDNTLSCASCHDMAKGGADGRSVAVGIHGYKSAVNVPTVFNSGLHFRQFWDGRAVTLEDQAGIVVELAKSMGGKWPDVITKLSADTELVKDFKASYADGLQAKNVADSLAIFERSLTTPNARFDKYLRGDKTAISADELKGYQLFKKYGCVACHQGVAVGGNMFQTFGVMGDYFRDRGNPTPADLGRYNTTKNEADKHVFKVPSLRNVALTAPYFHDASAPTLEAAVAVMFKYQLGRAASREDQDLIVKFLHSLTGELDGKPLEPSAPVAAK